INMGGNDVMGSGNLVDTTSNQAAGGNKAWSGFHSFSGGARIDPGDDGAEYPEIYNGEKLYVAPPTDFSIATKKFVADEIAGITVPPNPFSPAEVQIVAAATQVVGIKYNSILNGAVYLATLGLSLTKRG